MKRTIIAVLVALATFAGTIPTASAISAAHQSSYGRCALGWQVYYRTTVIGDNTDDVCEAQYQLYEGLGYTTIDGIFGTRTLAAVVDYQRRNGLVADGIVGPRTWVHLECDGINLPTSESTDSVYECHRAEGIVGYWWR